jgi:signal transduction histidine kinase
MAAVLIFAVFAVGGTIRGIGPFAWSSPIESLVLLQSFLATSTVASLALAAEARRRRVIEMEVLRFNAELTDRVEARTNELRRLHGRLAEAQQVARVGSWEWNIASDVVWWSEELYRIYELPLGSPVTYATFLGRVHPEDRARVEATVSRAIETQEPFAFEHRIIVADGSERILAAHGRVTVDESGRPSRMVGIEHDVTDRKRAEEERIQLIREQEARLEAEESNRSKDQFLATLSHELRTPLNAVLGWAELLRNHRTDEELRVKAIDAITRNVWIQAQLVSDILDVARIRSGTLRLQPRPIVLLDVINGALEVVAPMMASKNIKVRVTVADGLDGLIGDGQRLQQAFWNILSNAAKFTPPNGHVGVSATKSASGIEIAVEDDGPGIDPAFLPHVFEQFRQADGSVTRQHGGLGLGLAICHQLVRMHNGEIVAANRPGGGAAFTIRLPVQTAAT